MMARKQIRAEATVFDSSEEFAVADDGSRELSQLHKRKRKMRC
jgi:hypothetical protein